MCSPTDASVAPADTHKDPHSKANPHREPKSANAFTDWGLSDNGDGDEDGDADDDEDDVFATHDDFVDFDVYQDEPGDHEDDEDEDDHEDEDLLDDVSEDDEPGDDEDTVHERFPDTVPKKRNRQRKISEDARRQLSFERASSSHGTFRCKCSIAVAKGFHSCLDQFYRHELVGFQRETDGADETGATVPGVRHSILCQLFPLRVKLPEPDGVGHLYVVRDYKLDDRTVCQAGWRLAVGGSKCMHRTAYVLHMLMRPLTWCALALPVLPRT